MYFGCLFYYSHAILLGKSPAILVSTEQAASSCTLLWNLAPLRVVMTSIGFVLVGLFCESHDGFGLPTAVLVKQRVLC